MNNHIDRRAFLRAGLAVTATGVTAGVTAACGDGGGSPRWILPTDPRVAAAEKARKGSGRIQAVKLDAVAGKVDLGGPTLPSWSYGGALPGKEIRVRAGDTIEATLTNRLPADTSIHWHGLGLRNDMDGVPTVTQSTVKQGGAFTYRFTAGTPGTYWFHPHTGVQLDRGLYAPLIVEDPAEPGAYDHEWTVILDDWIDGIGYTPDQVLAILRKGMGGGMGGMDHGGGTGGMGGMDMGGSSSSPAPGSSDMGGMDMGGMEGMDMGGPMLMGATSPLLGGDAGDVRYPHYLVNGRIATAPYTFRARKGQRVRLRIINAGSDTAFRLALGGHRMRVTHTDGYAVAPVDTDALLIGMGERYDVTVTLADGVFPLTALAEGKGNAAMALVRTGSGSAPHADVRPKELNGKIVRYSDLRAADSVRLRAKKPDVEHVLELTGGMMHYNWQFNGRAFDPKKPLAVEQGQRTRVTFRNKTTMWHPMHVHGHTFQLGDTGPRKDTVMVLPRQTIACDFDADNPGQWMIHCHNIYHAEVGMMALLGYRA